MSQVVGLSVRTTKGCPHLRGVVIEVNRPGEVARTFEHKASASDASEDQLHALGTALNTQLKAHDVVAVVIREAGYSRMSAKAHASMKKRLRAEGVALSQARRRTENVVVSDINALAKLCEMSSKDLEAAAESMCGGDWREAASSALAAQKIV